MSGSLPAGYALDNPPAALPEGYTLDQPPPPTTVRGVVKNVGAGVLDAAGNVINFLTNPNLLHPLAVAGGTAYDAIAPTLGLPRMTPEQRADLYGSPQPGQTQLPPEQQEIGTRIVGAVDQAIPGQKASDLPASGPEAMVRRGVGGAGTALALGPGGILPALAGAAGAVAAPEVAKNVPDWAKPGTELAVNTVPQMVTGANASRSSTAVDAADAATAQLARDKFGIPVSAPDITAGSTFRTPSSVQASTDAFQRNLVSELGENPNTPDLQSRNRITTGPGGVMDRTATRVSQGFEDVANRTNINPTETGNLITQLANLDGRLNLTAGITDADKAAIRRNIDLVQNAAVNGNGSISGKDYQALTKYKADIDNLASNRDPNVAAIGMQIKSAIDDAFQKSAAPADQEALSQLRYQWRLMKTVQPLAEKAQGANIDPGAFADRAVAASRRLDGSTGGIAYTGGGTIGELARVGELLRRGSAPVSPSLIDDILHPPGGGLGYMIDPKLEAIAHGAQIVGKQLAGPYLRSGFNTQQVINNALYRPSISEGIIGGAVPGVTYNPNQLLR